MSLRLDDIGGARQALVHCGKATPEFEVSADDVFEAPTETPRTTEAAERRELAELLSSMLGPA